MSSQLPTQHEIDQIKGKLSEHLKADPGGKELFCSCWPCARAILTLLRKVVPPPLQVAIDALIKIGDGVFAQICKP